MIRYLRMVLVAVAVSSSAAATAEDEVTPERAFRAGMLSLADGEYDRAIFILSELDKVTDSPRVKLELARALFFAERYREARKTFQDVYRSNGLPYSVRRSINFFLGHIDRRIGYFKPKIGLAVNSNPLARTDKRRFTVFGLPVELKKEKNETSIGVGYGAEARLPLDKKGRVGVVGAVQGVEGGAEGADYFSGNLALAWENKNGKFSLFGGSGYYERDLGEKVIMPFVRVAYRNRFQNGDTLFANIGITHSDFERSDYLNGRTFQGDMSYGFDVASNTSLIPGAKVAYVDTKDDIYNQVAVGTNLSVIQTVPSLQLNAIIQGSVERRKYRGIDPVFGERRKDTFLSTKATIVSDRTVLGLFPSISVGYEKRNSSLDFYSFDRVTVGGDLLYRF